MDRRAFFTYSGLALSSFSGVADLHLSAAEAVAHSAARHRIAFSLPPSSTPRWAWTIDDGVSSEAVSTYLKHAQADPTIKFTYFVTSMYPSWTKNAPAIRELIARGQVQVANHTHTHQDLRTLSAKAIQRQLLDCQHFLEDQFQVTNSTFWRPPYGFFNNRVLAAAADAGFSSPIMWFGVFGTDSQIIKMPQVLKNINGWVANQRIVLDHANFPLASQNFGEMMAVIKPKGLKMVTLAEAFPTY